VNRVHSINVFHDDRNKRCWRDDNGVESVQREEEEDTKDYYPKYVMANLKEHSKLGNFQNLMFLNSDAL